MYNVFHYLKIENTKKEKETKMSLLNTHFLGISGKERYT